MKRSVNGDVAGGSEAVERACPRGRWAWIVALLASACGGDTPDVDGGTRRDAARFEDADAPPSDAPPSDARPTPSDAPPLDSPAHDGGPLRCEAPTWPTADYFVAPSGRAEASGRRDDPLSLATALSASGPVRAGDRVEVAGGTYVGRFVADVSGSADAPIVVAAAPGARVILDSNAAGEGAGVLFEGDYLELHGFEITHSGERASAPEGVEMHGSRSRLVNCVLHDNSQGIGFWSSAVDSELYGNVIYNNGFEGPTRGHGHAIYTQNASGTKRITRNVIFFGYGYGIHAYTEGGSIRGFDVSENVWFRAGASRPGASTDGTSEGCLIGGLQPVARARLIGNHSFGPTLASRSVQLGWGGAVMNEDVTLRENYWVGRLAANGMWASGTLEDNAFHGTVVGVDPGDYPTNTWGTSLPSGTRVVVHDNAFDPTRLDLVVYDWSRSGSVAVDLSDALPVGARWELRSVYDLFGAPIASGVYEGGTIMVPMGTVPPPQPRGDDDAIAGADDPGSTFGVFVLRSECAVRAPSSRVR